MPTSPSTSFKLPLRQSILHDRVERLGLALGAARERTVRAGLTSVPGEHSPFPLSTHGNEEGPSNSSASRTSPLQELENASVQRRSLSSRYLGPRGDHERITYSDCGNHPRIDVQLRPERWK